MDGLRVIKNSLKESNHTQLFIDQCELTSLKIALTMFGLFVLQSFLIDCCENSRCPNLPELGHDKLDVGKP